MEGRVSPYVVRSSGPMDQCPVVLEDVEGALNAGYFIPDAWAYEIAVECDEHIGGPYGLRAMQHGNVLPTQTHTWLWRQVLSW